MSKSEIILTHEQIEELANELLGTCQTFYEVCDDLYNCSAIDLHDDSLRAFDELVFQCADCGWWHESPCSIDEDDQVCDQCLSQRGDDEEC